MQPTDPLGPVFIGAREIYDRLVSLDTKVSMVIHHIDDAAGDIKDHEGRLRVLERGRWPLPTLAVLAALGSLTVMLIMLLR